MQYINQIKGFWNFRKLNNVSSKQSDLYFAILECFNLSYWCDELSIPNITLQSMCQTSSSELFRNRNSLVQLNLIYYKKGKKNSSGKYKLLPLYTIK